MSTFIHTCATISLLDSFENGILEGMDRPVTGNVIHPDYKAGIGAAALRRMSHVVKLGTGAAVKACGKNAPSGIIAATGLGCFDNSVRFANEYVERPEGLLSPSAFIQSTDNTVAGQIALVLACRSYNITFTHKGIAFGQALTDAIIHCEEEGGQVLLGGVDEKLPYFEDTDTDGSARRISEGASFFLVGREKENALAEIRLVEMVEVAADRSEQKIKEILGRAGLPAPGLVLYGDSHLNRTALPENFMGVKKADHTPFSGIYYTNAAFGMQLAAEIVAGPVRAKQKGWEADHVLVLNNFNDEFMTLIYISAVNK